MNSIEIAKIAGVSRSTVSKVLNNYPDVNEETKKHVLEIVKKYNYAPDFSASVLAGKKTNTIGFFMNVDKNLPKEKLVHENDFYSQFLNVVVDSANALNYFVTVCRISTEDAADSIQRIFSEKRIDSAIIVGADDAIVSEVAKLSCPVVFSSYSSDILMNRSILRKSMAFVGFDAYLAFKSMMEKLILNGYKKIGMIHAGTSRSTFTDRYKAFFDAMTQHHLPVNDKFVLNCDLSPKLAANQISKIVENGDIPEAFVCINDIIASAVMERLNSLGISVPEDVAVTGFDDIPYARYTSPPLTTIKIPVREMALRATERAIELINNPDFECSNDIFETKPVYRKSAYINTDAINT